MYALKSSYPLNNTLLRVQHASYPLLFALMIVAIVPFFLLCFYAHPGADDFSYAAAYRHGGLWNSILGEYMGWKGRYFAIFSTVLFHQSGDMILNYKYPLLLFLGLLFFALYFLVRSVFEEKASLSQTLFCSAVLGVFYVITLPRVSATIYWADGAFQYQVGSITFLFLGAALLKLYRDPKSPLFATLGSSFFAFAAIGSHEIFMVATISMVGLMFFHKYFIQKVNRISWSIVLIVSIISSVLLIYAPGNEVRMQLAPENNQQLWFSISRTIYHGGEILGGWLSHPALWLLSILYIPLALYLVYIKGIRKDASITRLAILFTWLVAIIGFSFFATWWIGAKPPPVRILNVIYLLFLIGWFILLLELVAVLTKSRLLVYTERFFTIPARIVLLIATTLLCLSLVSQSHVREAYSDLLDRAPAYDKFMHERYAYVRQQVKSAGGKKPALTVGILKDPPKILVYTDISRDRKDWRNNGFAEYFGLASIATAEEK